MFKTVIIEDEAPAANLLEKMLEELELPIEVAEKCSDLPEGVRAIRKHQPNLVFLDIELPVYSGIQLLDFFNPEEINFHIIFTTAFNEFALKAFEMSAADYLLKPLQHEKLSASLEKLAAKQTKVATPFLPILKENLQHVHNRKIVVPVSNGFEIINLNDISHLRAEGSYTEIFFSAGGSLLVSKNLKHFEYILAGLNGFLRVHRSYIANIHFAKKLIRKDGGILILENKTELPVAEEKMQKVLELLQKL